MYVKAGPRSSPVLLRGHEAKNTLPTNFCDTCNIALVQFVKCFAVRKRKFGEEGSLSQAAEGMYIQYTATCSSENPRLQVHAALGVPGEYILGEDRLCSNKCSFEH
jgi:hypothetical protein